MAAACDSIEELLQAHLDGELSTEEQGSVDAHLAGCAACRGVEENLRALGQQLGAMFAAREDMAAAVAVPGVPAPGSTPTGSTTRTPGARTVLGGASSSAHAFGYRLEQEIARGGMGTVYRATQLSMDRPVALKVLAPSLAQDEEFVARFLREARVAATLAHPNLVAIYDVGREGDTLFYSMELIDGEDAEAAMKRAGGHLSARRAVEVALGVARALEAARQANIVHRDVKPANILLTSEGGVKLTDLGLAKATGGPADAALTQERKIIGSPNYMSPEQAGDIRAATHRSDVYSLAATLLHFLTGQVPFAGGSPIEVIARVLRDPPTLPERLPEGEPLDADLRRILTRALAKDPASRHATAGELALELARWLEVGGLSADAPPPTPDRARSRRAGRPRGASSDAHRTRTPSDAGTTRTVGGKPSTRAPRQSDTGRLRRPGAARSPLSLLAVAVAAALFVGVGLALLSSRPTDPTQVAPAPTTTQAPAPAEPRRGAGTPQRVAPEPHTDTPSTPPRSSVDAEGEVALATLEADLGAVPPPSYADVFRRSRDLALRLGDGSAGERAVALRDAARERVQARWAERAARARELEETDRWAAARAIYREHLAETGEDVPSALEAQLALRSLEAQLAVRLEGDLARADDLLARGELAGAAELVASIETYAGTDAAQGVRTKVDEAARVASGPRPPAPGTPAPASPGAPAADEEALALAARERKGREVLSRVRGLLEQGDVQGARASLEAARAELDALSALKDDVAAVVAAVERARPPLDDGALLAAYFGGKVSALEQDRVQVTYDFEADTEAADWAPAAETKDFGGRLVQRFLDGMAVTPPRGVDTPWAVHRKMLVGFGWSRRSLVTALRTDRPLAIEVEARGRQNTLVGLQAGERTLIVGLGYMLEELPISNLVRGEEAQRFVGRLNRATTESRKRGPSAVIVREGRLMDLEELQATAHAAREKAEFTVELTPVEGGGHELALKVGRRTAAQVVLEDIPERVRVNLLTLGVPVAYDRLVVTGAVEPKVLEELRRLAREVHQDPDALRRRVQEEREREAQRSAPGQDGERDGEDGKDGSEGGRRD